ncbi:hypothetical protein P8452_04421 [Trifolium repens]|nr:hypothetical protein P8452_04421 [Trifolium repens]
MNVDYYSKQFDMFQYYEKFKLNFQYATKVKPAEGNSVSPLLYAIPHPSELFATDYDTNYLVDLMGRLHGVGAEKTYERNGVQSKMVVIELDNDGYRFKCTLFGEFVDVLNAFIASGETQNVIVMLMLAKVKKFQGRATVQNTLCASKLLFNPEYTIAVDLRKRMMGKDDSPSPAICILQDTSKISLEDDFLKATPITTIEALKDNKMETNLVVCGTIKAILDESDWFYTACLCNKKVYPDERMYFCEKCNKHVVTVFPRYRLKLRVIDSTDSATFVVFDRDTAELFKKSCSDMIDSMGPNCDGPPKELLDMMEKTYLFKVETNVKEETRFEKSYRVKRLTDNADLIARFKSKYSVVESVDGGLEISIGNSVEVMKNGDASAENVVQDLLNKFSDEAVSVDKEIIDVDDIADGVGSSSKRDFSFSGSNGGDATPVLKKVKIEKE